MCFKTYVTKENILEWFVGGVKVFDLIYQKYRAGTNHYLFILTHTVLNKVIYNGQI